MENQKEENKEGGMFFGGGISGFFKDLYYGAIEKGYNRTHPRIGKCNQKDRDAGDSHTDKEKLIKALQELEIGEEDLSYYAERMEEITNLSEEEEREML